MLVAQLLQQFSLPGVDRGSTVDGLVYGNDQAEISGIVTAFTCSIEVIEFAVKHGANVIITHESLFYHHHDQYESFGKSIVIEQKLSLLERYRIHVIRAHDYPHHCMPDLITEGLAKQLGWKLSERDTCIIKPQRASELIAFVKQKLEIPAVQFVGDLDQTVHKAFVAVGFRGNATNCVPIIEQEKVDVLIVGEGYEWEMPEYIRDARALGHEISYIVVGHQCSEEWGMSLLANKLQAKHPSLFITYKKGQAVIQYV